MYLLCLEQLEKVIDAFIG